MLFDGLTKKEYRIQSAEGTEISAWRIAAGNNASTGSPAVVHVHGGFCLKPLGQEWLKKSGIVLLYVAYSIATEKPFPTPGNDVYAAFQWAVANAASLEIDKNKIGFMGFGAGGSLALYTVLRAKADSPAPLPQAIMLIYPMLDPDTKRIAGLFTYFKMWREKTQNAPDRDSASRAADEAGSLASKLFRAVFDSS